MKVLVSNSVFRRCFLVLLLLVVVFALASVPQNKAKALSYVKVFGDEFNDTTVDSTKWNRTHKASNVNSELQYYTNFNAYENSGRLILRARRENYGGRAYTAGRVDTRGKFHLHYGEVEFRAQLPKGKGIWPALWLVQKDCPPADPCTTWPPEIDVVELRGSQPTGAIMTNHFGRYPNNSYHTSTYWGPDFSAGYHTFKVIWDPGQVVWYVDGVQRYRVTTGISTEAMHIIMNIAVGGHFDGNPTSSTVMPVWMNVDYVRVYRWQ